MTESIRTVSWIEETSQAVSLARNVGEAKRQADLLEDSRAELGRTLSRFRELHESAAVVSGLGWEGRTPSPDVSRALDQALQSLESRESLDPRSLSRVPRALDEFGQDVATSLKAHWYSHAANQLGDVTELLTLSETLSGFEGIAEVSHELSATLGALQRSQAILPNSRSVQLLTKAQGLLRQLESSLKPTSVRRFLSSVARGGASVGSLTPDVTKWLADHDALDRFKVVAGSPDGDSDD